jgi:copper chaperone NosL
MRRLLLALLLGAALLSCARGPARPAALDPRGDACAWCRMAVSDPSLAAQIAAPSEEPKFFDDIGCLVDYLAGTRPRARGEVAYVVDHRTGAWIPASTALYVKNPAFSTPMGSHLLAHADAASRQADPAAAGGTVAGVSDIFGPAGPPDGSAGAGR